jgi:hypothetical protein
VQHGKARCICARNTHLQPAHSRCQRDAKPLRKRLCYEGEQLDCADASLLWLGQNGHLLHRCARPARCYQADLKSLLQLLKMLRRAHQRLRNLQAKHESR